MLDNSLSASEGAGNCSGAALCYREECIYDPLPRVHRTRGHIFFEVRPCDTDRPALDHGKFVLFAVLISDNGNYIINNMLAAPDTDQFTLDTVRDHNLMVYGRRLLDRSQDISGNQFVSRACDRHKIPQLRSVEGRDLGTSCYRFACNSSDLRERPLDSVIDIIQHARPEFDRHRHSCSLYFRARSESGCFFVDLNGCAVSRHIKDLADKSLAADTHNVRYVSVCKAFSDNQRSRNFSYFSAHLVLLFIRQEYLCRRHARQLPSEHSCRAL